MLTNTRLIILFSILVVSSGCALFSPTSGDEVIYGPTEVGTPVGAKVTGNIGPKGGVILSPDGRLTLTVPPNAVTENVAFSIQPINNKVEDGLGFAYRLEPSGKTFNAPLLISLKYSEQDIEGTYPQALKLAYQDETGAWREQSSAAWDIAHRSVTVSTKHLSDWTLWLDKYIRIIPAKTKIRAGESVRITVKTCEVVLSWFVKKEKMCEENRPAMGDRVTLKGPGKLTGGFPAIYTAPAKQPKPNVITVVYSSIRMGGNIDIEAKITIIGDGYRATGEGDWLVTFSGVICSLEKPFIVYGSAYNYDLKFTPSSDSNGNWTLDTFIEGAKLTGSGTYSVENIHSDKPRIKIMGGGTVTIPGHPTMSRGGSLFYLDLTPIDTDECGEVPPPTPGWGPPQLKGKGPF